jgi:hypothetical protein
VARPARADAPMADRPRELVIGDPHDQAGLVAHIPDGTRPVRVMNYYHFHLWPKEKAYCAKCAGHRHRDGFTVELDDGTLALAGSKCAGDLWGDEWKVVRKTFQAELSAAGIVLDVRPVLRELESIRAALDRTWRPVVEQLVAHQTTFKGRMGSLYNALKRAADRADHCIVVDDKPRYYVEGWSFFATDPARHFQLALEQIDAAISAGHGQQSELGVYTVKLDDARDHLDAVAHAARGLRSFFSPKERTFFDILIQGAAISLGGPFRNRYALSGAHVVDLATKQSIGLPDDFPVLDTKALRRLHDLIS